MSPCATVFLIDVFLIVFGHYSRFMAQENGLYQASDTQTINVGSVISNFVWLIF